MSSVPPSLHASISRRRRTPRSAMVTSFPEAICRCLPVWKPSDVHKSRCLNASYQPLHLYCGLYIVRFVEIDLVQWGEIVGVVKVFRLHHAMVHRRPPYIRRSMERARERSSGQEVARLRLLVHQLQQQVCDLLVELPCYAKPGPGAHRYVGETQLAVLDDGSVVGKCGAIVHRESAEHGIFLENRR